METLIQTLLSEIETDIQQNRRLIIDATFYDIADHLKKKFGEPLGEIYLESQIPSEFISGIRETHETGDNRKLTETLVTNYKREQIRLEQGRKIIREALEPVSNMPSAIADEISKIIEGLHYTLRQDYKYLSVKPYFLAIKAVGDAIDNGHAATTDEEAGDAPLLRFKKYHNTGEEPSIIQQIELHIAINRLYQFLQKNQLIEEEKLNQVWSQVVEVLTYKGDQGVSPKEQKVLRDLLSQVNKDIDAISRKLAATFIDEYKCAEEQMRLRHIIIQNELAFTEEYLNQIANSEELATRADPEKIKVAIDKVFCLKETFPVSDRQRESAARKSFMDVERAALGVSTVITPVQLTDWIKIYSIIFSNQDYLEQVNQKFNFSVMRDLISNLTTFHLYDNIAQLKNIVERHLSNSPNERTSQFKRFTDAFKQKLLGLMESNRDQDLTLRDMIDELNFLQNKSIQFVIAETFKGFQHIVDAFDTSSTDFFVRDQDAMLKESRALYNQICSQSLKIIRQDTSKHQLASHYGTPSSKKKSWLAKLFS